MMPKMVLGLALLSAPCAAMASDLVVDCNITRSDAGGAQYSYQKRFEFTWDVQHVDVLENQGGGWQITDGGNFIRADNARIVIGTDASGNPKSYIDRRNGSYFYKAEPKDGGSIHRGTCKKAGSQSSQF